MSKTFSVRPVVSQRGRGRGRGQSSDQASQLVGVGRSTAAAKSSQNQKVGAVTANRPAPTTRPTAITTRKSSTGRGAAAMDTYGQGQRFAGTGDGAYPRNKPSGPPNPETNETEGSTSGNSLEQRATHAGAYTVISPNEKKRRQIQEQAERETRQHEQYKQQNTPSHFSYVGTVGGGQAASLCEVRRHQQAQNSKTNRLLKEQERREKLKQAENSELDRKKSDARKQADRNREIQRSRSESLKSDMNRVNQAFLDRLEAQQKGPEPPTSSTSPSKPTTATTSTRYQPSFHPSSRPPLNRGDNTQPSRPQVNKGDNGQPSRPPLNRGGNGRHRLPPAAKPKDTHSSSRGGAKLSDNDAQTDGSHFEEELQMLQSVFPQYESSFLRNILEQCDGSADAAIELLGF